MKSKEITKRIKWAVAGCICLATVFSSCQKDEDSSAVPNWETEFCDAYANANAVVARLTFDDGSVYDVASQGVRVSSGSGNRTLRAVVRFARQGASVRMYSVEQAFCQTAIPTDSFKIHPYDPVKLTSVWRAGKYVNFILGEMTTDKAPHAYGFCIDSLVSRTMHVSLLHQQPAKDAPSYTQRRYLSMPVQTKYVKEETYDSISVTVQDFSDKRTFTFAK